MFSIIHLGGDLEHHPGLHLGTTSLSPSSGGGSHQPGNISNPPPPVLLHEAAEHKCKLALFLPIQLLTWILSQLVYCTAAAFQFLQTWAFSWVASQAPSIIMIVGQLLDFILLHLDVSIMASLPECDSLISSSFWIDVYLEYQSKHHPSYESRSTPWLHPAPHSFLKVETFWLTDLTS